MPSLGDRISSIFKIILTSCVDKRICCFLLLNASITFCCFISFVPFNIQSIPSAGFTSFTCLDFTSVSVSMGERPEFSAKASGILSSASANARKAYCSIEEILSASAATAIAQLTSAAPPPYTTLFSVTRFLTTHRAS
ncbi:hypothetical protein M8J77_022447 [Diaphorina citri]|nr:hypothetical protein M8J77_022447 [Diaphorina citri]